MLSLTIIDGYLGRDPEKTIVEGVKGPYSKTTVSVGVSRDFGDQTDWFFCVFYRDKADAVEKWFRKGSRIKVVGRMESYKPKNDPQRTAWLLVADRFYFADKKVEADGRTDASAGVQDPDVPEGVGPLQDEDVPF